MERIQLSLSEKMTSKPPGHWVFVSHVAGSRAGEVVSADSSPERGLCRHMPILCSLRGLNPSMLSLHPTPSKTSSTAEKPLHGHRFACNRTAIKEKATQDLV